MDIWCSAPAKCLCIVQNKLKLVNFQFGVILQNDSVCLPPGLDCYKNEVKLSQDDCSVLPCKGIYAEVAKYDTEDIPFDKQVLAKYREYKTGFNYDKGE